MQSIDQALARYSLMSLALTRLQRAVHANPLDTDFIVAGLTRRNWSVSEARLQAAELFDDMHLRLAQFAVLDLCAVFEREFTARLGTALGEVRSAVDTLPDGRPFAAVRIALVRDSASFRTLDSMFALVEGHLSATFRRELAELRKQRNEVAHGLALGTTMKVSPKQARDLLVEVARLLW